jgi:hypothetical protein
MSAMPAQMAWPYGLHNATKTYNDFIRPTGDSSVGLPQYHWASLSELLTTSVMASSVDSEEDNGTWADANFPGLNHLGARRQFPGRDNYLHEGFDSDDESHDPS